MTTDEATLPHPQAEANGYDLLVANVSAKVITELAEHIVRVVRSGGTLIFSGILDKQQAEVTERMVALGVQFDEGLTDADWVALVGRVGERGYSSESGSNLLVGKGRYFHAFARVLDGDGAEAALRVKIEEGVLVEVTSLSNLGWAQFDVECVGIGEVFDVHGLYDLSKKALCTVSPSEMV